VLTTVKQTVFMRVGRICPGVGQQWIFPSVTKSIFPVGTTMVKFQFSNTKLTEKLFSTDNE